MHPTEMPTYINQNTCVEMVKEYINLYANSQKLKTTQINVHKEKTR